MKELIIGDKSPSHEKLIASGFKNVDSVFELNRFIMNGELCVTLVNIEDNIFTLRVTDSATSEEYVLHNVPSARGEYVGRVRREIEKLIDEIKENCFDYGAFIGNMSNVITEYIYSEYGSCPEFLWDSSPDCAVFRRQDTGKWFGVLMRVPLSKFGFESDDMCEIINLHFDTNEIDAIVDKKYIFYAFHMNKRHWISVLLDDNTNLDCLKSLIETSYCLACKK